MENNRPELNQEPTPTPVDATNYEPGAKSKKIKPIIIIAAIVLVLSAIATTAVIVLQQQETKPQAQTPTETTQSTPFKFKASVPYVLGTAYKIIDERKIEIKEGDILEEGDAILTEENSKLILSLDDGSVIRIGANSKITLSKMQTAETTIEEEVGIIFARVQKDESHRFITKTGNVTVESLGTTFSVENSGEDVNVKVFKNKVAVNETAIDKESIEKVEVEENQEWKKSEKQVKNINKEELSSNEFISWSLKEEKIEVSDPEPEPEPEPQPEPQPQTQQISLTGEATDKGVSLSWTVTGIDAPKGFKIVRNRYGNPKFPGDYYVYLSDSSSRSYTWKITDGETWHFRVCKYTGSGCEFYSNQITVTASKVEAEEKTKEKVEIKSQIESISLEATKGDNTAKLEWSVEGTPPNGFKVVWSTESKPVYPPRKGDSAQWVSSDTRSKKITDLKSDTTYHFRVCEYLSGSCGVYSNELELSF